jgi:hypothetical protein
VSESKYEHIKNMGINTYITHRMFVAALRHDDEPSAPPDRRRKAVAANKPAAKLSPDPRFSAIAQAEAATRRWAATAVTTLL